MKRKLAAIFAALLLSVGVAGVMVLRSTWFHDMVRHRVVEEIAAASGGRVEMQSFEFEWKSLQAETGGLVIHGLEGASEQPLFRAKKVRLGLKIISLVRREIDIASLAIEEPEVNLILDTKGQTNIPVPKAVSHAGGAPVEKVLNLAVGEYRVAKGIFRFRGQPAPMDVSGRELYVRLQYDRKRQSYAGTFSAGSLQTGIGPPLAVTAKLLFRGDRLQLSGVSLKSEHSRVEGEALVQNLAAPAIRGFAKGRIALSEIPASIQLPVKRTGDVNLTGEFHFASAKDWSSRGRLSTSGLALNHLPGISASANYAASQDSLDLRQLQLAALDGTFSGSAKVEHWTDWDVAGEFTKLPLDRVTDLLGKPSLPFNALLSGNIAARGPEFSAEAQVHISPAPAGVPLEGELNASYEKSFRFAQSYLQLPGSRLNFRGVLEERIEFSLVSRNLNDFRTLLKLDSVAVELENGNAKLEGTLAGASGNYRLGGQLEMSSFLFNKQKFQTAAAIVDASPTQAQFKDLHVIQDLVDVSGNASVGLSDWKLSAESPLAAKLTLKETSIERLLADAKVELPVKGTAGAQLEVQGTRASPRATGRVTVTGFEAYQEKFDRMDADFRYTESLFEVVNGRLREGAGAIDFTVSAEKGDIRVAAEGRNSRLKQWENIHRARPDLDGLLAWKADASFRRAGGQVELASLNGQVSLNEITVAGRPIGEARLTATTRAKLMTAEMSARLRESRLSGKAEWNLGGNSYGLGQVQVTGLTFAALQQLGILGELKGELAILGQLDGEVGFSGPILHPEVWTGMAKITRLEVRPNRRVIAGSTTQPVSLHNQAPLLVHLDGDGIQLQSVHLVAEGTDLEASGTVSFRKRNPWNLRLLGKLNLPALSSFEPDLLATGVSTLDATVRGSYDRPQLSGRMELKNASFHLRGVPNGLDMANGAVVFDRTRANIEKLTAQTGGGDLSLSGFVDFGGAELLYRLQANAQRVRVRYPETLSTTFSGNVSLTGTSSRSLLSGTVTVTRIGLNPRTDIGSLLAEATGKGSAPASTPPNDFVRGMQIDLKIDTSPDAELQTSLARDIQPEADLRVRGSPAKLTLLGRASITQGEIQFFGNKYTITRGDISFFNPVKIEPVVDFDLETTVRGITVNISFTGPISRLDVSYRSDPPLQSAEIVGLLAVGRTPGSLNTPSPSSGSGNPSFLQGASNTLLGQAISAPVNGRLNRLFGVSNIKIDPDLTGVTNTPQARLTVEQQLTKDVTVTYITNLNRTQQQIVRLQWDFSKNLSLDAVRDENGIFGIDFLWKHRF